MIVKREIVANLQCQLKYFERFFLAREYQKSRGFVLFDNACQCENDCQPQLSLFLVYLKSCIAYRSAPISKLLTPTRKDIKVDYMFGLSFWYPSLFFSFLPCA